MGLSTPVVGVVVPGSAGDQGWVDGGWEAESRLREAGVRTDIRVGAIEAEAALAAEWSFAVLHGIQFLDLALALVNAGVGVVLSDVEPDLVETPPAGLTMVDWRWDFGAERAGQAAARETDGPIGFVAGPIVPTQRRAAAGFVAGVAAVDPSRQVTVSYLSNFRAVDEGAQVGAALVAMGCTLVAHSADEAGSRAVEAARDLGATTYGFLTPVGEDAASLRNALGEVLANLAQDALAGRPRPGLYACSWDLGEIRLERP